MVRFRVCGVRVRIRVRAGFYLTTAKFWLSVGNLYDWLKFGYFCCGVRVRLRGRENIYAPISVSQIEVACDVARFIVLKHPL